MTRYAQNGGLTRFDTGSTHEQNPLSGIPIGRNNSVEENETKQNNFVYSNRIFLDSNIISQYNLPKSLIGKSVADATKIIDDKFKGRNDKISQSTKDLMLSKIAEAQESMKPQEPEMEQPQEGMEPQIPEGMMDSGQMAFGGFADSTIGQGFGENATGEQKINALGTGLGVATAGLDLGKVAFGKPTQDTSGITASAPVNSGTMIGGSALKGASAGAAFGPLGAGIGAGVGAIAGLLGSRKEKKAALENSSNFAARTNAQFSDQYAMGGPMDILNEYHTMPNGTIMSNSEMIDPPTNNLNAINKVSQITGINTTPVNQDLTFNTKKIVQYQPGVTSGKNGSSGFYLYSKKPTESGFDYKADREFIKNENMNALQRTPQWQDYMKNKSQQLKQLANGGPFDPMYYENLKLTPRNTAPIESQLEINGLKPIGTTTPYTIGTQPTVDISNANKQFTPGPSNLDMLKYNTNRIGNAVNKNIGNLARYAPIATNAYQLSQLKKPQGERLDRLDNRYKSKYIDEASLQNIADQTMNNTINAISQSGASQGQTRASILGSQLQRTKALSDAYSNAASQNRAIDDRAQTFNLGIDQVNLQQSNTEKDINARDQAAYRNAKREYITGIGEGIGDIGKEQTQKKIIAKTLGYKWDGEYVKSSDGNIITDPDTGKPMTGEKLKELQSTKDKKALGGYLIKNKTK